LLAKAGSDQGTFTLPAAFPSELVQAIMALCDTETLKNFRLTTSVWDHALGPIMFNQVSIVPHLYFIERFFHTFRTSKLRECVRKILIDNLWAEQLVGAVEKSPEIGQRRPYDGSMFTLGESIAFYASKTSYEFDTYYYPSLESNMFATIFTLASALETVEADFRLIPRITWRHGPGGESPVPPPPVYRAFLESIGPETAHLQGVVHEQLPYVTLQSLVPILSTSAPCLKGLILHSLIPRGHQCRQGASAREELDTLSVRIFSRLSRLDMRLTDLDYVDPVVTSTDTVKLLRNAPNLQTLRLHCQEHPRRCVKKLDEEEPHRPVLALFDSPSASSPAFSVLKSLWLQNLACTAKELEHFVAVQCPQLRHFTIKNCFLLPSNSTGARGSRRACWVTFLKHLKPNLSLETVEFRGCLTNLGRQHWHIMEDVEDETLDTSRPGQFPDDGLPEEQSNTRVGIKPRLVEWFLDQNSLTVIVR
jgi:hypothetical protein